MLISVKWLVASHAISYVCLSVLSMRLACCIEILMSLAIVDRDVTSCPRFTSRPCHEPSLWFAFNSKYIHPRNMMSS